MPKGNRGSRGPKKSNYVRLSIKVHRAPKGMTKKKLKQILMDSIVSGTYELPETLAVSVLWSNNPGKLPKEDEWQNALNDSAQSGRGWDRLLLNYLDGF